MSKTTTLKVGDEAPDFELPSKPRGEEPFKLSDHRGSTVVINFVPAAFSPTCSNQLPIIEEKLAGLADTVTVAISTDNGWSLKAWAEQTGVSERSLYDVVTGRSHKRVKDARNLPRLPNRRPRARLDPAALVAASEAARQAEFDRMVGEEVARLDKREMRRQARRTAIIERHAGSG